MEKPLDQMTDKELKNTLKSLYDTIYVSDCFSTYDLVRFDAVVAELEKRGYEIIETCNIKIRKREE
ncbi:MAG: hypothetical protein QXS50_03525 [Candidatus Caldarchaeum sp.]